MTASNVDSHPLLAHIPHSALTDGVQQPFGERTMVLAACPLADAGAALPDAASC